MEMNKASAALMALLCAGAGLGGAFLATRGGEPTDPAKEGALLQAAAVPGEPLTPQSAPATTGAATPPARTAQSRPLAVAPRTVSTPPDPAAPVAGAEPPLERVDALAAPPALEPVRLVEPEPVRTPEPAAPQFEELVVAADSVIGLQVETSLTSERARVEDDVVARVTRDVRVGDRVAIPAGSRAEGEVTLVERGGRLRERARLGVRFTSVILADGTRVRLETDTVYREGRGPGGESAAKIGGGAIGGAIIGGILGGAKGAIIGGSAGAGAGTAAVLAGGRNPATLPAGTPVTVRITRPAMVPVEP